MKKTIILSMALMLGIAANAQVSSYVSSSSVSKTGTGDINVSAQLRSNGLKPGEVVVITPYLYSMADTLAFPSVELRGRRRYIDWLRHDAKKADSELTVVKVRRNGDISLSYSKDAPYFEWMRSCDLGFSVARAKCDCRNIGNKVETCSSFMDYSRFMPKFLYAQAAPEPEKYRVLSGSARIEFPVNVTELIPDFRNNIVEIGKIVRSVNSVLNDPDVTIEKISLSGSASPEGNYSLNEKLAKGRTESIRKYVAALITDRACEMSTSYVVEDWDNFRTYVQNSSLAHKKEILETMDQNLDPDVKEWKIKSSWPEDYAVIYQECYPGLRKTDYAIGYGVVDYSEITDLKTVFEQQPSKLSLAELMTLADTYERGSYDYYNVIDTAAVLFPLSEVANLNAANAAMERGNLESAARYLKKSGNSAQAEYATGVLAYISGNYEEAISIFKSSSSKGITEATSFLKQIKQY